MTGKLIILSSFLVLLVWWAIQSSDERVKVVFCNVGQGDGVLVTWGNRQMLIDTGGEDGKIGACLSRHLPFWDKTLDIVLISHWDSDHSGGLASIGKYYKIGMILCGEKDNNDIEQNKCSEVLRQGDVVRLGEIVFDIYWPRENGVGENEDSNLNSLVALLSYRTNSILLTGDINREIEELLVWRGVLRQGLGTLILKVSHHGSKTATSETLLNKIKPKEAVISVGKNSFGHPSDEVLERLGKGGIKIRRTDKEGDIIYQW